VRIEASTIVKIAAQAALVLDGGHQLVTTESAIEEFLKGYNFIKGSVIF
jgi:hypothetical protein